MTDEAPRWHQISPDRHRSSDHRFNVVRERPNEWCLYDDGKMICACPTVREARWFADSCWFAKPDRSVRPEDVA